MEDRIFASLHGISGWSPTTDLIQDPIRPIPLVPTRPDRTRVGVGEPLLLAPPSASDSQYPAETLGRRRTLALESIRFLLAPVVIRPQGDVSSRDLLALFLWFSLDSNFGFKIERYRCNRSFGLCEWISQCYI